MANNSTIPPPAVLNNFDYVTEALAAALNAYYTPLLVLLGALGNIVSIYVFYTSKLRMQSTRLYLSVLAISDTIFLFQLVPPWLNAMQYTNLFHKPGFCQVFVYSTYVSCCLSAWLVVAFTVERFVAVLYPLRRNSMCTQARAKTVIFLLVVGALVLNIPVIKYASPTTNDCNIDFEYMEHAARFNYVDTAVSFSLPLFIIVVLNARITVGIYKLDYDRRVLQAELAECPSGTGGARPYPGCARPSNVVARSQHRITRMLLIVSTVFVVLNVPAYTMRILAYAYDMSAGEYSGRWAALQQLALMFFNTNFGINFILYCLSGQNFRRALCQSTPCLRRRARRVDALRLNSRHVVRASSVTTSYASGTQCTTGGLGGGGQPGGGGLCPPRRHRSEPFIERWTFDNSRVHRANGLQSPIEMEVLAPAGPAHNNAIGRCTEGRRNQPANLPRTIPFLLFPYRNLMIPRRRTIVDAALYR